MTVSSLNLGRGTRWANDLNEGPSRAFQGMSSGLPQLPEEFGKPKEQRFFLMTHSSKRKWGSFLEKFGSHFWAMSGSFSQGGFVVILNSFVYLCLIYYVFYTCKCSLIYFFQKLLVNVLWDRTGFLSYSRTFYLCFTIFCCCRGPKFCLVGVFLHCTVFSG